MGWGCHCNMLRVVGYFLPTEETEKQPEKDGYPFGGTADHNRTSCHSALFARKGH